MEEIWKNIKGLTGYQISNLGRVKSLAKDNAAIATGINKTSIAYCCKQEVGGFIWKYNIKANN